MDTTQLLQMYDQDQRIELEYPETRKERLPHLVRFVRQAPGMNFVSYSAIPEGALDREIQAQIDFFRQFDQPFSWSVLAHDRPAALTERLIAHGFEPGEADPLMVLDMASPPPALLVPLTQDVRRITDHGQIEQVIAILEQVYGASFAWLDRRLAKMMDVPGMISIYIAYVDQQPACAGWMIHHSGSRFGGLFGGATLPQYRKHGLYTAVLAARLQEAARRGLRYLYIEPSEMSRPIVTKYGFQTITTSTDYVWKGERTA